MRDPKNDRGNTTKDITQRLTGQGFVRRTYSESDSLYYSNGFFQNIVDDPAQDATREWFEIETDLDTEDRNISRMIQNRLSELGFQKVLKETLRDSRRHQKGGLAFIGVKGSTIQNDYSNPIPYGSKIDYINVIDNKDSVDFQVDNRVDPTKKDYNKIQYRINGGDVDESRIIHIYDDFQYDYLQGQTVLDIAYDAVIAQDSALWSVSKLVTDMVTKVFKSDDFVGLPVKDKTELLCKMKHYMETNGAIGIASTEEFDKMVYNVTGIKEIFEFIFDNLSGMTGIPKNVLLGKAYGVVTAGEYDTLNYYAMVGTIQELVLTPVVERIIDMIIQERDTELYFSMNDEERATIDYEIVWNTLWRLDPVSQADADLKGAQRDQIDVTIGKASPQEVRELDPRYTELQNAEEDPELREIRNILNMDEPELPPMVETPTEDTNMDDTE